VLPHALTVAALKGIIGKVPADVDVLLVLLRGVQAALSKGKSERVVVEGVV
jgi:hypothetical protein